MERTQAAAVLGGQEEVGERTEAAAAEVLVVALDTPVAAALLRDVVLRATLVVAAVALDILEEAVPRITAVVKRDVW